MALEAAILGDSTISKLISLNSILLPLVLDTNNSQFERVNLAYILAESYERSGNIDSSKTTYEFVLTLDTNQTYPRAEWEISKLKGLYFETEQDSINYYINQSLNLFDERIKIRFDTLGFSYKKAIKNENNKPIDSKNLKSIMLIPNPNTGEFTLNFNAEKEIFAKIDIVDSKGTNIFSLENRMFKGQINLPIKINNTSTGSYYARIVTDEENITIPLVIIK